jgi:hypothetical protein
VDEETHKARQTAHEVFDRLWKDGLMSRSRAYARLSHMLGITPEQCHMKVMTKRVALQVPDAVEKIRQSVIYARARQSARDKEAARRSRQC